MKIDTITTDCTGCGKCVHACRIGCLKIVDNGFCRFVNVVDENLCIGCGLCEQICPQKAIKIHKTKSCKILDLSKLKTKHFICVSFGIVVILCLIIGILRFCNLI
jgi:NAD-dependent dihydropyrimidine dehydrogenase PreA subunit